MEFKVGERVQIDIMHFCFNRVKHPINIPEYGIIKEIKLYNTFGLEKCLVEFEFDKFIDAVPNKKLFKL